MLLRKLVVVGLVGFVSLAASIATAEDAVAPNASMAVDGISFADPSLAFGLDRFSIDVGVGEVNRFANFGDGGRKSIQDDRDVELAVVASGAGGFDVAFAQRRGFGFNNEGDLARESRSSELRLGRGLRDMPRDRPSSTARWYVFAASEDEALVWQPGARSEFGGAGNSFALQDRVEIGDMQAGITYEQHGLQTSLAYVEREISVYAGNRSFTQDEDFAGLTLTYRH
jgi:hypothetical protein